MIISFIALSIVPVFIIGLLGINSNVKSLRKISIENLKYTLAETQKESDMFFHSVEGNIHFITSVVAFDNFISMLNTNNSDKFKKATNELQPEILSFIQNQKYLYQIKLIDNNGDEQLIVENIDGNYQLLNRLELNKTATKFYSYIAQKLFPNTLTFIPTEIKERKSLKIIPTISCIYHLKKTSFDGALVLQIYAKNFFNILGKERFDFSNTKVMLVNNQGYYLYHSDKKTDWNQLSASKKTMNLRYDFGNKMADEILSDNDKIVYEYGDYIIAQTKIFNPAFNFNNKYILLISVLKKDIFKSVNKYKQTFYILFIFFVALSFLLALLATQEFIGPIKKLIYGARVLAKEDYDSRVEINTGDEIEELANQFNSMALSLKQRKIEIDKHNEILEKTVINRTKDLKNEKNKLDTIFNNVPFGFILFDKVNNILSVSKAISKIYGGKSIKVLDESQLMNTTRINMIQKVKGSGVTLTNYTTFEKDDGSKQFLEHIFIPVKNEFITESVLEIVIDITERKRLQNLLIHSEKLAATGELAAVIAHEMRNSLTSVRMLLQILSKKTQISKNDFDSFNVALDSVSRMEKMVNDLLQLSRPANLELKPEDLNVILNEGIEFSKSHIQTKDIKLNTNFEENLPKLNLDKIHIKEVFINLILNSIQAIENSGHINITSKIVTLSDEIKDMAKINIVDPVQKKINIQEIIFNKGTKVVQIEISDDGMGIHPNDLKQIFNPFFTTKLNGTGLGLSFVKNIINQHGAVIEANSTLDNGCKFTIYFPIN